MFFTLNKFLKENWQPKIVKIKAVLHDNKLRAIRLRISLKFQTFALRDSLEANSFTYILTLFPHILNPTSV